MDGNRRKVDWFLVALAIVLVIVMLDVADTAAIKARLFDAARGR